ncbi:MAG: hypothetical protein M1832_002536 [Thelocarpon impressellum]|nr:MAG: hypothetical protein M1832_002536 [Thelocarpon impressellum]
MQFTLVLLPLFLSLVSALPVSSPSGLGLEDASGVARRDTEPVTMKKDGTIVPFNTAEVDN